MEGKTRTLPAALVIHGGSGTLLRSMMNAGVEARYRGALESALREGWQILENGGTALDAVERAVIVLEDAPVFNAGRGSVFTSDGCHEMDAAIMCGKTLSAGAVAAVRGIRNPIQLASKVRSDERYVLLCSGGAEAYAQEQGFVLEPDAYFFTQERFDQLMASKQNGHMVMDHDGESKKFGTVGAVALDVHGDLAAATSTGGLTNKKYGRIGDTPLIGAGTYANNRTCAVSCTGYGEAFVRACAAHEVSSRMLYLGESITVAADAVVHDFLPQIGGEGGLIAVDAQGQVALTFNTEGMYRGWIAGDGVIHVDIFGEEKTGLDPDCL